MTFGPKLFLISLIWAPKEMIPFHLKRCLFYTKFITSNFLRFLSGTCWSKIKKIYYFAIFYHQQYFAIFYQVCAGFQFSHQWLQDTALLWARSRFMKYSFRPEFWLIKVKSQIQNPSIPCKNRNPTHYCCHPFVVYNLYIYLRVYN